MARLWKLHWYACPINKFIYCSVDTTTGPVVVHAEIPESHYYFDMMVFLMTREILCKLRQEGRRPHA